MKLVCICGKEIEKVSLGQTISCNNCGCTVKYLGDKYYQVGNKLCLGNGEKNCQIVPIDFLFDETTCKILQRKFDNKG